MVGQVAADFLHNFVPVDHVLNSTSDSKGGHFELSLFCVKELLTIGPTNAFKQRFVLIVLRFQFAFQISDLAAHFVQIIVFKFEALQDIVLLLQTALLPLFVPIFPPVGLAIPFPSMEGGEGVLGKFPFFFCLLEREVGVSLEAVEEVDELHLDDFLFLTQFA